MVLITIFQKRLWAGLLLTVVCSSLPATMARANPADTGQRPNQPPAEIQASAQETEEVLVVGRRPGPPLWRVFNGNNTLWILGTLKPLPKQLLWDSSSLKHLLSQADAYIAPPNAEASASNPFKVMSAVRRMGKLKKLKDGKQLQDVVPEALFKQFLTLKAQHAPRAQGFTKLRPMPAAERLLETAYQGVGLVDEDKIESKLGKLAKKQKGVEIYSSTSKLDLEQLLEIFSNIALDDELKCFEAALNTISVDLKASIDRANAWANGDARALLDANYPQANRACNLAIEDTPVARQALNESKALWLNHAKHSLAHHRVSISSLPIAELSRPDGLFAQLKAAGYQTRGQQAATSQASDSTKNSPSPQPRP